MDRKLYTVKLDGLKLKLSQAHETMQEINKRGIGLLFVSVKEDARLTLTPYLLAIRGGCAYYVLTDKENLRDMLNFLHDNDIDFDTISSCYERI